IFQGRKFSMSQNNDAHNIALEWIKQIITLSTGIIVLSATFITTIFNKLNWSIGLLIISWILLLLAIIFGLETISVITNSRIHQDMLWTKGSGKKKIKATKWLFINGISFFIVFALINFYIQI
ncbi:hypothetical protein ACFLQP_03010, partial [Acidobacteriota bacterium]